MNSTPFENMNNIESLPLVSVCVITYNSSKYILELLESVREQTYSNIELIVSDDYSTDDTVTIVSDWLNQNRERFQHSNLRTTSANTGVCKNINRAVRASSGEWVKSIAGDDKLKPNCIEVFVNFAKENRGEIFNCDLTLFSEDSSVDLIVKRNHYDFFFSCVCESFEQQKKRILREYTLPGPGWFYSRKLYELIGGFDERYIMMDEWPFVFKCLQFGHRIVPVREKLVEYRVNFTSLCHSKKGQLTKKVLFDDWKAFFYDIRRKEMLKNGMFLEAYDQTIYYKILTLMYYKGADSWTVKVMKLLFLTSPYHYILWIKNRFILLTATNRAN